jgi:hypothetical protein
MDSPTEPASTLAPISDAPTPEARRRSQDISGVPAVLSDGREWLLARGGLWKTLTPFRDRIYDEWAMTGRVPVGHVLVAAFHMLRLNYHLTEDEAMELVRGADPANVADPVIDAMVNITLPRKTWTEWARSALFVNGLKPADVPPDDLPRVLAHLVMLGKAVPPEDFTDAGMAAEKIGKFRSLIEAKPPMPTE